LRPIRTIVLMARLSGPLRFDAQNAVLHGHVDVLVRIDARELGANHDRAVVAELLDLHLRAGEGLPEIREVEAAGPRRPEIGRRSHRLVAVVVLAHVSTSFLPLSVRPYAPFSPEPLVPTRNDAV